MRSIDLRIHVCIRSYSGRRFPGRLRALLFIPIVSLLGRPSEAQTHPQPEFDVARSSTLLRQVGQPDGDVAMSDSACEWAEGFHLPGVNGSVTAAAIFNDGTGDALYIGGSFTLANGIAINNIARWDGASWSAPGTGLNSWVYALTVFDDGSGPALYAGGSFTTAGGVSANRIAKWDGASWSALGTGMSESVYALTVFDDGGGPALYAGGGFTTAGGVSANRIAKWDGASWSTLGTGMDSTVEALAIFDDGGGPALYAGGYFNIAGGITVNGIARWNGIDWSALGTGVSGKSGSNIKALSVFNDGSGMALFAGGLFTTAGGVTANRIARWDGSAWSALGTGVDDSWDTRVETIAVFDDGGGSSLYIGGRFTTVGDVSANHIARWDGESWSALGSGVEGCSPGFPMPCCCTAYVSTLTTFDDGMGSALFTGGSFFFAGDANVNHFGRWNGLVWASVGTSRGIGNAGFPFNQVSALESFNDGSGLALYAGGIFKSAGGTKANSVAKLVDSAWHALGSGISCAEACVDSFVLTMAVFDDGGGDALFIGGIFDRAGGVAARNIAKWDGSTWSPVGEGTNGSVSALTVYDDGNGKALFVGGYFDVAGGVPASRIAKWDGTNWSSIAGGVSGSSNDSVFALMVYDDGTGSALYVGGRFAFAGTIEVMNIARWNGSAWATLGDGIGSTSVDSVFAMAVYDDSNGDMLHAGGSFSTAGGLGAHNIAKWNGANWIPLGAGVGGFVSSLEVFDDWTGIGPSLFVGGAFDTAGEVSAEMIAKWDGLNWFPVGGGMGQVSGCLPPYCLPYVQTLRALDDGNDSTLYAGGRFGFAGGVLSSGIAKWSCGPPPPCVPPDCNERSTCQNGRCICDAGFGGVACDECLAGHYGPNCLECPGGAANPCNGNGFCDDGIDGFGICACDAGWTAVDCSLLFPLTAVPASADRARFLTMTFPPEGPAGGTAIQVEFVVIDPSPGAPAGSQIRYLNAVGFDGANHGAASINCPDAPGHCPNFACAVLGCAPEYRDWAAEVAAIDPDRVIHVTGDAVVPSSVYGASQIAQFGGSSPAEPFSTGLWADVVPAHGVVNVLDLGGLKDWLVASAGSPCKTRAWMRNPVNPFLDINVLDLSLVVNVLTTGQAFPGPGISVCP